MWTKEKADGILVGNFTKLRSRMASLVCLMQTSAFHHGYWFSTNKRTSYARIKCSLLGIKQFMTSACVATTPSE